MVDRFGHAGSDAVSWFGELTAAGLDPPSTLAVDWSAPIDPLAAAWQLHSVALWVSGHARPHLDRADWNRFVELWDPDNSHALLHRRDAHIIQAISWSDTIVGLE